jgi:hypothetical protein
VAAGATYTQIATNTLGSAASSVTFSSIPGTYTDLVLVGNILGNVGSPTDYSIKLTFNNDGTSVYSVTKLTGNGTTASSARSSNVAYIPAWDQGYFSTTAPTTIITNVLNYSNATTYKTALTRGNAAGTATQATVGLWRSTSAITRLDIAAEAGNFGTNTTFSLYGISAA